MIHALEPRLIQAACLAHPGRFIEHYGLGLYAADKEKHPIIFLYKEANEWRERPSSMGCILYNPEADLNQDSF